MPDKPLRTALVLLLAAGFALAACSDDESPSESNGPPPDVTGTYTGDSLWSARATRVSDGTFVTLTCSGSIEIGPQVGNDFGGRATTGAPCDVESIAFEGGRVDGEGNIEVTIDLLAELIAELEQDNDCRLESGGDRLAGRVDGNRLTGSGEAVVECAAEGRIRVTLNVDGTR